jgi:hypothetical protein
MTLDVPVAPAGDLFEENDSFAAASSLAAADQTYANLSINAPNDDDYYSLVPVVTGTLNVSLAFLNANGDIDLEVFDSAQARVAISESTGDAEQVSIRATAGETYFIRVFGYSGAVNANYSMTIDVPEGVPADSFEQNDSFTAASSLAANDQTYNNLSIDAANDDDYYSLVAAATGTLNVSLAFTNSQGDIDLQLFDAGQQLLASAESTTDTEQVSLPVTAGEAYYIRAFGPGGAINPSYSMTIDQPEAPAGDSFENNDGFATASVLAASDQTYNNLSIEVANDDDYYSLVPTATGTFAVSLAFLNSSGNINLELLNASQQLLANSASTADAEQLNVPVTAGQTYYVRVFGAGGAINPSYSMTIDFEAAPPGDAFENNDTFATARALSASNQTYGSLSIDAPNDDDYYSIAATVSGTLTVSLAFVNSQGDIDLELLSAAQARLGLSESTVDAEQLSIPVTAGQTYVIRAFGYEGAVNPNYSMTIALVEPPPGADYYISLTANGNLNSTDGSPSLASTDADILKITVQPNGQYGYRLHFDGSDVGLTTSSEDVDAFAFLGDGSILVSTTGSFSVPAAGGGTISGNREDLLRFVPSSLGETTAGQWSLYFDGSDVGLSSSSENVDALAVLSDGRLLISTTGNFSVSGASGQDKDLLAFSPTSLGTNTAGSWSLYFDGSDVGLSTNNEDINALYVRESAGNPTLFFSTLGSFSVTGVSGANEDVFAFNPTSLGATTAGTYGPGLAFDGSLYGLSSFAFDGIHFGALPSAGQAAAMINATTNAFAPTSLAMATGGYRPQQSEWLTSSTKVSIRVEAAADALVAAVLESSSTKQSLLDSNEDCSCHSPLGTSTQRADFQPATIGALTAWDLLGDSSDVASAVLAI